MTAPRLAIDLDKIHHNARTLVERLGVRGIAVTAVTKAALGAPEIAEALLRAGVTGLGDSRIENLEAMRRAGVNAPMTLIRSPMLSQANRVVASADVSFNTELTVIRQLSAAAVRVQRMHGIVLMVELGDLREGLMPDDLEPAVREVIGLPKLVFKGIGTNLACRSGIAPDAHNMAELATLAETIEAKFDLAVEVVSGGNSANLNWALSAADTGRINDLRLGEAILLGCEPLNRQPIEGLHADAITLVAEVVESKVKPTLPRGDVAQSAFGEQPPATDRGPITQSILAIGRQDTDPSGLSPPPGIEILGASSDHLIAETTHHHPLAPGDELRFGLNYSALLRAMTSPYVAKAFRVAVKH